MTEARFLVDSDICVYLLEARSDRLRARVAECGVGELVTSAIVYAEVGFGVDRSDPIVDAAFSRLFEAIPVVPFDARAAEAYWALPFRRGKFDRLIGAHALAADLIVVTANSSDFADIPGLKVEDWTQ